MTEQRSPILFCLSAPVAGGKSTVARMLAAADLGLTISISTTTRAPRPGETDGVDYHFVSRDEFLASQQSGAFLETTEVSGNFNGTGRANIQRATDTGTDLLLTLDYIGARFLRREYASHAVVIYLAPPSFEALQERVRHRGDPSPELVEKRLLLARTEMIALDDPALSHYRVVNDQLELTFEIIRSIVIAEQHRYRAT